MLWALAVANAGGGYDHNHPDVRWNTLETAHFFIHWPESTRPPDDPHWFTTEFSAGQLARIAEEAYPKICGQFDYYLDEKVHVVVYDQDSGWEGNGFAIAEYDWTGFAARWGPVYRQRGRAEFLEDVFVHEFAHIVSLKAYLPWSEGTTGFQVGGLSEDEEWLKRWGFSPRPPLNADLGVDLTVSAHAPFWWAEGGAEYWSEQAGTNEWGSSRDAFLRMTVAEGRVLDLAEWTTRMDKTGFDGERGYNHGYAFGLWLREKLGNDAMTAMAATSRERWRWSWDTIVEKTTGRSMEELYASWRRHLNQHYGAQVDAIRAEGVVAGRELALVEPAWERNDDAWQALEPKTRDERMDGASAYQELSRYSPDGAYVAWFDQGLNVREIAPNEWGAIGGSYMDDDDAVARKEWSKKTVSEGWAAHSRVSWSPDSRSLVAVGPEDFGRSSGLARFAMDHGLTFNADGYNWSQLVVGTLDSSGSRLTVDWRAVPNTLRAVEAAWSPSGDEIAFVRYGDGTHNLWSVGVDGSRPTQLTAFADGTQIQGLSYVDDGSGLLLSLFHSHQQDLWFFHLETRTFHRLTDTPHTETDPVVGPDGLAWFSSDADGVYNVYTLDPASGEVQKKTNLLGGSYGPDPVVGGHLLYTAFTGHGFRVMGVAADSLLSRTVDYPGICRVEACDDSAAFLAQQPEAVDARGQSEPYSAWRSTMPVSGWPVLRTTDKNVEVGASFFWGDYVEKHYLEGEVTFGKDNLVSLTYWNQQFWPSLNLGYMRYSYKGHYGYGEDADGLASTSEMSVVDLKFEQVSDDLWAYASYVASDVLWMGAGVDASRYAFRDNGDGTRFVPFTVHAGVGAYIDWTPWGDATDDQWINPRGGRRVYADYNRRWTAVVDPELAGAIYDDGQVMDRYGFHQITGSYTEYLPVTWWGLWDRGTLQLDIEGGWISRNVMGWDEFMAGGRHPYHWGNGTIGNNVQFSGYEGYSLTGETMLIANAAYRFPLTRNMNWKSGPVYTDSMYLQLFGSVGNLWSYRVEGDSHIEGYSVVPDAGTGRVRREIPFKDYASKNSPVGEPHYALSDIGAELRVRSFIWNDFDWDSFLRIAYGFQRTAGYGDVNADLVQSSVARDAATELSGEVEPATLRVYLGIGTGW
ncbi:MAG: hypothetical protein VX944_08835 [Myxococcota bacterium]|nr:hypothetical protein [Myxococcota bacterium]